MPKRPERMVGSNLDLRVHSRTVGDFRSIEHMPDAIHPILHDPNRGTYYQYQGMGIGLQVPRQVLLDDFRFSGGSRKHGKNRHGTIP